MTQRTFVKDVNKTCFWVEGMIAEWDESHPFLIEQVRPWSGHGEEWVLVDFRELKTWTLCDNDNRLADGGDDSRMRMRVREPTDEELALIAKNRLMGVSE